MKLIVTRPADQAAPWVTRLQGLGVQARALPLLRIEPLADPAPLRAAWAQLQGYALVVFVSANAVHHFFASAASASAGDPPAWPTGVWAGSVGPGTSTALRAEGVAQTQLVEPDPAGGRFDSEGLWEELQFRPWAGRRVLVVRGEEGRDWLADALRARGATVDFVAAYRRCPPRLEAAEAALLAQSLAQPETHVWHFSSSEAIGYLRLVGQRLQPPADWGASRAIASHPRIVQSARDAGFGRVQLVGATIQDVADWVVHTEASLGQARTP